MKWAISIILIAIATYFIKKGKNNVCKTFNDYYTDRDNNPNCYYNPDHELEAKDIIRRRGYPVNTYEVTTDDGYILTLYRITHGLQNKNSTNKPVLLNHGLTFNCGSYLLTKKALAFMLADVGYDVWLGNFRGSRYSRKHKTLNVHNEKFWNFSFHELGVYDVRSQIKLITEITNKKIIYIGFSQGCSAGYIYSLTYPDLAKEQIDYFVALAPGVFLDHPLIHTLYKPWQLLSIMINYFTGGEIYPRPLFPVFLFKTICFPLPFQIFTCQILDMILLGYNYEDNDPESLPVTLLYNIDATSVKTINHYMQAAYTGNFQYYDYGEEQNKLAYLDNTPPHYNLSNIPFDNFIVYSENDKLLPEKGIHKLYQQLSNRKYSNKLYKIKNSRYNHIEVLFAKDSDQLVFTPIINELQRRNGKV